MTGRRLLVSILVLAFVPTALFGLGLEAITLGFAEAWTGNGYVPTPNDPGGEYDFPVTGSEPTPIDPFGSIGVRIGVLNAFDSGGVLTISPALEIGWRRYLLYASGRVVPAQIETALGDEDNVAGIGSADVLTLRVPIPIGFEFRFGDQALLMSISPTWQFRFPLAGFEIAEETGNLSGMTEFFMSNLRFLMPELALGYRFSMSDYLDATIRATAGVSVLDLMDTSLPWYDQMRVSLGVELGFRPPFGGIAREREGELPEGIEPFPGSDDEAE
ncbi:MAG: hypothetical protein ACOC3H_01360 [bacterium]